MSNTPINNDELSSFVASTLRAIALGIGAAETEYHTFIVPHEVDFEVAVRATKGSEAGGGLKIQVFSAEGKRTSNDEQVSRITFKVRSHDKRPSLPINYPSRGVV